ncbi:MAG: glycosyltransferase family 2 protein [Pontixanthobacter sp.]
MVTERIQELGGPKLSVVVPCYDEQDGLAELHRRVSAAAQSAVGDDYEFIFVNDGSKDNTWSAMQDLAQRDRAVVCVNLARNHGHQLALTAGLSISKGQRVFVLDADLQDPPELLGQMMDQMDQGHDVVYGKRVSRDGETIFKRASASIFYRLLHRMADVEIPRDTGDFRLMSRRVVDVLNAMPEKHRFIRGMVAWIGFRQTAIEYQRDRRFAGSTNYPLPKMIRLATDAITGFSTYPLRLATFAGFGLGLLGIFALLGVIGAWATGYTIKGWASLAVLVLMIGSIQMIMLGIFGEYIGRMYMQSKERPLFMIDTIITGERQRERLSPALEMQDRIRKAMNG